MYLVDTNVFLEILLGQDAKEKSKAFLQEHRADIHISDLSLHSIGIILFREKQVDVLQRFIHDVLPHVTVLSLSRSSYSEVIETARRYDLDFDDSYQLCLAKNNSLAVVTMDNDFRKVETVATVMFL